MFGYYLIVQKINRCNHWKDAGPGGSWVAGFSSSAYSYDNIGNPFSSFVDGAYIQYGANQLNQMMSCADISLGEAVFA